MLFPKLFPTNDTNSSIIVSTAVTCLDPGMSNSTTQIVTVNINGDEMENINPTQQLGEQTYLLSLRCHLVIHSLVRHILHT